MSWRRCPRCGNTLEGDARFCPRDGNPLVEMSGPPPQAGRPPAAGGVAEAAKTTVRKAVTPQPSKGLDPAATLSSQVLDTRYSIVRKLGEGGMSYVYEAREINSGQSVAIKVLSPKLGRDSSSVERLRREAGLAMRLEHPNVCRIMRLGETEDGLIYLVMPYLRGELLSDREVKRGPMSVETGVDLLVQVCAGLHHAHQLHIVHRDLKPENVMLVPQPDGTERAVVMDFGLAKENRAGSGLAKLTATGIILGTPEFMSPEQIRGKDLDARSDVYALGIMAFEMFTGKLPFQGRNAQEMMIARLRGQPTPLRQVRPDLPPILEKVLARAMETEPANRYSTAREFGLALLETLEAKAQPRLRALLA
ncbi:MAG TPA: protein kinase [Gemmatimonadales bacterium]|nr:protein kinase [Gemmatimonadales bacterium]